MKNQHEISLEAIRTLKNAGYEAYLVGGCVRDILMGVEPHDYDVATNATPDQVEQVFPRTIPVGKSFGVVIVLMDDTSIEVATFRHDSKEGDGRRPASVEYTKSLHEDLARRDFTINAMAMDKDGKITDPHFGKADLAAKVICTVGNPNERFAEDHLRILRAIRFAANLGFAIEDRTAFAIHCNAALVQDISGERIAAELTKMLTGGHADRALMLLKQFGILEFILPEIKACIGVKQPEQFHPEGDVFTHTVKVMGCIHKDTSPTLAMAALLHDIGKPPTQTFEDRIRFNGHAEVGAKMAVEICKRLKFSSVFTERVEVLVANHMKFHDIQNMRTGKLRKFLQQPFMGELMALHLVDCMAGSGDMTNYNFAVESINNTPAELVQPERLVTGDDLIKLGMKPGPAFGDILKSAYLAQLEGEILTKEDGTKFVEKYKATQHMKVG